jgi:hypothetical protein
VLDIRSVVDQQLDKFIVTPGGSQGQGCVVVGLSLLVHVDGGLEGAQRQGRKVRGKVTGYYKEQRK